MEKAILGIDIAKEKFDVYLQVADRGWSGQFRNHKKGHQQLTKWVRKWAGDVVVHAGLEATGRYGEALARHLHDHQFEVSVTNPARVKHYAKSKLQRNKTDKLDARLIADFVATQNPYLWEPPGENEVILHQLVQRLNSLLTTQTQEKNRLQAGKLTPAVSASIADHLVFLETQIEQLRQEIQAHIDQDPDMRDKRDLLTSIPGLGDQTAAILLALMPDPELGLSSKQVTAYAGLTPEQIQSGGYKRRYDTLSKLGHVRLRTALYMPTLSSLRCNPIIISFAQRLRENGKKPMTIVAAAMRKMLVLAYGVLKSGIPFDPDYSVKVQHG